MANFETGSLHPKLYEAIGGERLRDSALADAQGELGLAVSYKDDAFCFAAEVRSVRPSITGLHVVKLEVEGMDGAETHDMELRARRGFAHGRHLQVRPLIDVEGVSDPFQAFLYRPQTAEALRADARFSPEALERMAQEERRRIEEALTVPATGVGIIPGVGFAVTMPPRRK